ncbi:MAG: hypothetical protein AABW59_03160 [archaeon]
MARKKVRRKAAPARRVSQAKAAPAPRVAPIQKGRDTVRIKTFIVEKPVIIQSKPERIITREPMQERYEEPVYDSRRSRYSRRPEQERPVMENQEDEFVEEEPKRMFAKKKPAPKEEEEAFGGEEGLETEAGVEVEDDGTYPDDEALPEDEEVMDEGAGEQVEAKEKSHFRSRGMFTNKWWKKALLWAFLFWAVVFIFGFALETTKLGNIDIGRNWFFLFLIILAIQLVWHKFDLGRFVKL